MNVFRRKNFSRRTQPALLVQTVSFCTAMLCLQSPVRSPGALTPLSALGAQEAGTEADARFGILAFVGGARYKPAAPAQITKLRRAMLSDPDPGPLNPREPVSRSDQFEGLGLLFRDRGGSAIFYDIEIGLLLQQGGFRFSREELASPDANTDADADDPDRLVVLPGDRALLGARFCAELCEFSLGRRSPDDAFANELTGGHGSLTGVHLNFTHPGYGSLHFSPLYRPELSGSYLRRAVDAEARAFPIGAPEVLRADFRRVAAQSRSYGHRLAYTGSFAALWLGLDYALHRKDDTANPAAIVGSDARFRRSIDTIQYTGLGIGYRGKILALSAHLQRALGSYRTLLAVPETPTAAGASGPAADRRGRIAGSALRSRAAIRHAGFAFEASFFLPEPARQREAGEAPGSAESGYVGFGDTPLASPILRGVLDFRPTPELCHSRDLCEGLAARNFAADRGPSGPDRDSLEIGFRDQAAVFRAAFAYAFEGFRPEVILTVFAPLARRDRGGRTPFARLKKDRRSFEYREIEIGGRRIFPGAGEVQLHYSRLYRRHPATGSLLAGESLRISILYQF